MGLFVRGKPVGLESTVTVFPRDPAHRLVGADLAAFLDRVTERMVAVGNGAKARVRAGRFESHVETFLDLRDAIDAAREKCRGVENLEIRLYGDVQPAFGRFLGARSIEMKFCAFVQPRLLLDARLCSACGWPLDYDGTRKVSTCGLKECGEDVPKNGELWTCWWLRLFGDGPDGIGERFVEEDRRLVGSPFFEALEGVSRASLYEWQAWG